MRTRMVMKDERVRTSQGVCVFETESAHSELREVTVEFVRFGWALDAFRLQVKKYQNMKILNKKKKKLFETVQFNMRFVSLFCLLPSVSLLLRCEITGETRLMYTTSQCMSVWGIFKADHTSRDRRPRWRWRYKYIWGAAISRICKQSSIIQQNLRGGPPTL